MKTIAILALASSAAAFAAGDVDLNDTTAGLWRGPDSKLRTNAQIQAIQDDADVNRKCHTTNGGYIPTLKAGTYTASKFHNCFRTSAQIFEYVDALVAQNPTLLTREAIASTVRGKTIYAYKLTSGASKPQSLYYQSLLHAREWIAGSSNLFTLSSILDDIANKKPTAADTFNLYFVPIANIDGYDISWNGNRYQRKNANQVDLNRNWPSFYKNPNPPSPSAEDYPGTSPFSEPETKGIGAWLKAKNSELAGWVDVHSVAGLILYPYGDTTQPIGNGQDEKFQRLGRNVAAAAGRNYKGQTSAALYPAYGCFDDYHYRTYKKPILTIEVAGSDFVAPASTIRTRGTEIFKALTQFVKEVVVFNGSPRLRGEENAVAIPYLVNQQESDVVERDADELSVVSDVIVD
ncbi:hypothetical protein DYB28_007975 [Aphanomyces astaci]|uniref:Peptidase M14 domain-containing protein n=2 Tax=Aphanomyces astaci TaxID=112090 RepID=A0A397ABA7_APHAT|nr:hypothetical protein DYB25_011911 [Aphanomyces astaci]RLO06696.1 hypothetical protein DYB28_007975 [Aphanomyces astaci]